MVGDIVLALIIFFWVIPGILGILGWLALVIALPKAKNLPPTKNV